MHMITGIVVFAIMIFLSYKKASVAFVILINIYIFRVLLTVDLLHPCYSGMCQVSHSVVFGLILPALSLNIILFRLFIVKKGRVIYHVDFIDFLLLFLLIMVFIYSFVNLHNIINAYLYFLKLLLLGTSYYFVVKLFISNVSDYKLFLKEVMLTFYFVGILFSMIAYLIVWNSGSNIIRLTLPGAHPIPFAQAIGISFILSFIIFITQGAVIYIKNKLFLTINFVILLYISIVFLATNTRGVILSGIFSIFLFLILNPFQISMHTKKILFLFIIPIIIYAIFKIDFNFVFRRFINFSHDQSISDRILLYGDSMHIFSKHLLGVGTNGYGNYSFFLYPHNLFLQNLAEYGVLGLIWNLIFVGFIIYTFFKIKKVGKQLPIVALIYTIFIYYFVETMFSFTLWMHKGMFFSMGLLSFVLYIADRQKREKL